MFHWLPNSVISVFIRTLARKNEPVSRTRALFLRTFWKGHVQTFLKIFFDSNNFRLAWVGVIAGVITEKIQRMNKVAQYAHTAQVLSKSQSKKDLECSGLSDNEQSADFWKKYA